MARSIGLAAYRAYASRSKAVGFAPTVARPDGLLVWAHATDHRHLLALLDISERYTLNHPEVSFLVTISADATYPVPDIDPDAPWRVERLPQDHPKNAKAFVAHWTPDALLWTAGLLKPNLLVEMFKTGRPCLLVDADTESFETPQALWWPEVTTTLLPQFHRITVNSDLAQRRLTRFGVSADLIQVTAPLQYGPQVLPCREDDYEEMSQALAGRPVWLAAMVDPAEVDMVLAAHRAAARLSHRLVLILVPADPDSAPAIAAAAAELGLRHAAWSEGTFQPEVTQVLIADTEGELGLWYRLAPLSFLGGSLVAGPAGITPLNAAGLGSAVLYGPHVGLHTDAYTRLADGGAAQMVRDADSLGVAVSRLNAPDQAASMAMAAWQVVSEGAEGIDLVIDMLQDIFADQEPV